MTQLLSNICDYINEKIAVNDLSDENYISTENMLPNKSGIVKASTLPNLQLTPAYQENDVLISNIRPYFRKIWQAEYCGGCSNDVLVLRAKKSVNPKFLYYVLSEDKFFDYATATSKGTKMPRGDKTAIMKYEVPEFSETEQEKIANILFPIDEKIAINSATNNNLEQQAMALFNNYFPYKINDSLPENWRIGTFGEIIELHDSKRIPLSGQDRDQMQNKIYPYYGAASLMDYVDNFIFDGIYLLLGEDGTVIDNYGMPILQYVWGKFWVNNHAHILTGKNGYNVESLYLLFKQTPIKSIVTGAVQAKISQANLKALSVVIPPKDLLKEFNTKVSKLFELIRNNKDENEKLIQLRDTLLPKLMSGEIDVSNVDISTDKLSFSENNTGSQNE